MGHSSQAEPHVNDGHLRYSYVDVHVTIGNAAKEIKAQFDPDIMIAIGGGGFFPARVLRTFLKRASGPDGSKRNIPIQAIGLSLYEEVGAFDGSEGLTSEEKLGKEVIRTQWLDFSTLGNRPLIGRRILIVDEVDDSRTTLGYAVAELKKDIAQQYERLTPEQKTHFPKTELAIFVVHNKLKEKLADLPDDVKYFPGENIEDKWVDYPWETENIELHEKLCQEQKALAASK
ncbi:hypothetical protein JCM16303_006199 [Sporobolomyces ruberrimus]